MIRCDVCNKLFRRRDNMLRHKQTIHDFASEEEEEEASDLSVYGEDPDYYSNEDIFLSPDTDSEEMTEEDPWDNIVDEAIEECQSQYEDKVKDLMDSEDVDQKTARSKAFEELRPVYRKAMIRQFIAKIMWFNLIKRDRTFKAIKRTVMRLEEKEGYGKEEAWKYSMSKRKYLFDEILKQYHPPLLNESQDMDADEDEEQDD